MSTKAYIGIVNDDNSIDFIYNHYDSYPADLGNWLLGNMKTTEQVLALIERGDASSVQFDKFYAETAKEIKRIHHATDVEEFALCDDVDYLYLFEHGSWSVFDVSRQTWAGLKDYLESLNKLYR